MGKTLFDKVWDSHVVKKIDDGPDVLFIDRHMVHEVTSPVAFLGLKNRNIKVLFEFERIPNNYKYINDNCGIPIIIYNIPSRSVIDMTVDTMARLFELKNIVGVKDATGDLSRVDESIKKMGKEFIQLTGEDGNAFEFNTKVGVGCISVTANIAPKLCSEMQNLSKSSSEEEVKEAEKIDKLLQPVHKSLFIESNPSPVKYAAKLLGLCDDAVRLPLVKIMDETKSKVKDSLISAKLLNE